MKAIYKKIGEKIEKVTIHHEETSDEQGNVIPPYDEEVEIIKPIMGTVYEENDDLSLENEVSDKVEPTFEERLEAMENAMLEMILGGI